MNILLAMIPAFLWGTTYAVTQYTLPDWPPLLLGALRALPAGLILLMLKPSLPKRRDWPALLGLGLINIAIFFGLIFVMALTLPAAISGVGMVSVPLFAMLYHWIVQSRKPNIVQILSGIALVGLAWGLFDPSSISLSAIGLVAMLMAIMCIVVGSTITKRLGGQFHWYTVLTWQLIIGGSILALASIAHMSINVSLYQFAWDSLNTRNMVGLCWIILLNTVLGYGMYVWLLQRMSVVDFTFAGIANPVAGIVTGLILMGEVYSINQYLFMTGMIVTALTPQLFLFAKAKLN